MRVSSDDTVVPAAMREAWHLDTHVGRMPDLLAPAELVAAVFGLSLTDLVPGDCVHTIFGRFHVDEVCGDDTGSHVLLHTWSPGLVSRFSIDVRRTPMGDCRATLRNSVHPTSWVGRVYFRTIEIGHHAAMEIALRRLARRAQRGAGPPERRWESWRVMSLVFAAHVALYRLLGGRLVGRGILILTTTGRKSGRKRSTPLFFAHDGEAWVIIASNGGEDRYPGWWYNVQARPDVEIEVGRERVSCRIEAASAADAPALFEKLCAVYGGYRRYRARTDRELTIFRLRRTSPTRRNAGP
jgi:deazaflavin-dependent oxidoreductase (nitroreductase family)